MITIARDDFAAGANDIALCRMNHTEVNGYGYIGTMQLTAANVTNLATLPLEITDVHAINAQMVTIPLLAQGTSIVIDPAASVSTTPPPVHIGLYPNPANDNVVVSTVADQVIEITNTLGQVVYTTTATSTATTIDLMNFDAGVYFVNIYTGSSKVTEQLIVE